MPLADAPDLPVALVWADPPSHPAIALLVELARQVVKREVVGRDADQHRTMGPPGIGPDQLPSAARN